MRIEIGENTYLLKMRTEEVGHKMEEHPSEVASKPLSTLSVKELSAALRRMRRNTAKTKHRKCRTTATLMKVEGESESTIATVSVANCLDDQFNAPRGRREALEKLKLELVELNAWTSSMTRELTTAFYKRYPNSRPNYSH